MKKQTPTPIPVLIRVPPALLKKVDKQAEKQHRSRTAEVCLLLEQSLKAVKAGVAA